MKNIKKALQEGELVIGTFSLTAHPGIVEMIGYAGFDFVIIDTEHGAASPRGTELENLIRAAYAADITPLVRVNEVPSVAPGMIEKALDFAAKGVVVPFLETKEDAMLAVRHSRFPPEGYRGGGPPTRSAKYGWEDWTTHLRRVKQEIVFLPLIESRRAVDNIEEIITVKGIDAIFFGPFDLSMTLGLGGFDYENPLITECMQRVYSVCKKEGVPIADFSWNIERAKKAVEQGCTLIVISADIPFIHDKFREIMKRVDEELRPMR